jgi:Protein of unknown function (DUF3833)
MLETLALILAGIAIALLAHWVWLRLFSFNAQVPEDYRDTIPQFDISRELNGPMEAEGIIYDFSGRVASRFTARMSGSWDGPSGTLTEDFSYASGRKQRREWRLKLGEDGNFVAVADDIVGTGNGRQMGATVRLAYRIRLPEDAGGHVLDVVDWMYLSENGAILNKSEFRKFGIKVGELVASFRKAE